MFKEAVKTVLGGLCLALPAPLLAEEIPAQVHAVGGVPASAMSGGFRIDGTEDGFQLVTHGVWVSPQPAIEPKLPATDLAPGSGTRTRAIRSRAGDTSTFRRAAYLPQIYAAESRHNIPSGLLDALVWTESRYNPFAVSHAGAAGLGQLMPGTARELGVANRFDPAANISGAARYLRQMLDRFGLVHLAVAAYNAGPGAVERAGGIPRNGETPTYVSNVLSFWGFK